MRIQHNIMAMNAYRNYNTNTSALSKNLEKLSSGYKINRAGDDAAGLAISEKMRAQITGLNAASKNVKDGISLVKTAEGAMQEIQDMLNRMDYLATQSANGTYDNEVDRLNLQKEVDQLRSEINRIADSANFNGIKLLDGKAGVNTTAFTGFTNVAGEKGHNGVVDISSLLGTEANNAAHNSAHLEVAGNDQVNASAVIDLKDLELKGVPKATGTNASDAGTGTVTFNIGGKTLVATLENSNTNATADFTASDIASALAEAIQSHTDGVNVTDGVHDTTTATNNNGIKIGDAVYQVTANDGTLELKLAGTFAGGTYKALSHPNAAAQAGDNDFTKDQADAINKALGFEVKVTGSTGGIKGGDVVHETVNVVQAKAFKGDSLAGIDLQLTEDMIEQGATIKIDGKTFTIELNDSTKAGAGLINLAAEKAAGADKAALTHILADKLSQQAEFDGADGRKWVIGSSHDSGKAYIHFEQTNESDAGKELKEYKDLTSKIEVKAPAKADKGAGVAMTIDPSKIAAGNKLNIDGKTFTFFKTAAEATAGTSGKTIGVSMEGDVMANLKSALENAGYTVDDIANGTETGTKVLTVRSAMTTTADEAAVKASKPPVITGEGLTLQIGDTSESYNQLSVKIGDMHTTALGIDALTIGNPEGASAAIKTIRDAINQVSGVRGDLGATQNRLEHTANNLSVMAENIQDAESTIRDTDVAEEMMAYTKNNILIQSAQAMLAQANAVPQGVLQLLG